MNDPIIVFGGTGHYGRRIVRSLLAKDEPVRVLSRCRTRAVEILGTEPEIIEGDILSKAALRRSLEGVRGIIICVSAFSWKAIRSIWQIERDAVLTILEIAVKNNIPRLIYTSGYDLRPDLLTELHLLRFGEIKLEMETAVAASGLNWTILGCAPSMDLLFAFIRKGRMIVPGGGPPALPAISSLDVGEIAAQAVLRNDLQGRRLRLPGPEALSFPEAARRISSFTGNPVRFTKIPLLPLRFASLLVLPVNPFLRYVYWSLKLLNHFPPDIAAEIPRDHRRLRETFDYTPTTFDMELRRRYQS